MPPTPDHQLGVDLRLRWAGGPLGRQRLESMVRDLVGADQSLLAPLLHLVGRPAFTSLDPTEPSRAMRLISRDRLLRDLEDTYQPRLLARLQQVLDGYLTLEAADAGASDGSSSHSSATSDLGVGFDPVELPPTELVDLPPDPPSAAPDGGKPPAKPDAGRSGRRADPERPAVPERPHDPWHAAPPAAPGPSTLPADDRGSATPASRPGAANASVPPTGLVDQPAGTPASDASRGTAPTGAGSGTASGAPTPATPASSAAHPADPPDSAAPSPSEPSPPAAANPSQRLLPWLGAALVGGTLLALALQTPWLCRGLGFCPETPKADTPASTPSSRALAAAEKAAAALAAAGSLDSFERALSDLDRELLRLSGDPLSSSQQQQRQRLQSVSNDGQQRLRRERQQAEAVSQATSRLEALPSLPPDRQEPERASIRQSLEAIPAESFSHGAAREQLGRLTPVAPASAPAAEPAPDASTPESAPPPSPEPAPAPPPAPEPRRAPSGGSRWDSGGWSPPPRRQAPAPVDPDDGNSNAPPRDDPLF